MSFFFPSDFPSVRELVVLTAFFSTWQAAECRELNFNGISDTLVLARELVDAAAAPAQQAAVPAQRAAALAQAIESLNRVVNQVCSSAATATEV